MELLEDPTFKSKYQKHKLRVKLWESDFMEKYGRKPNKNDIKEADATIKEAYKMYWKLKTRALEETLMDITFPDDSQTNVSIISPSKSVSEKLDNYKVQNTTKDTENIDPCHLQQKQESDLKSCKLECKNVDGVWGDHLTNHTEHLSEKKQNVLLNKLSPFQLSQEKFRNSSFPKRNPRKSLPVSKIKNKSTKDISSISNTSVEQTDPSNKTETVINAETQPVFGEPVKIVYAEPKAMGQSVNTIQQLLESRTTVKRDINQGWLKRCSKENNMELPIYNSQRCSSTSDSGIESMESSLGSPKEQISVSDPIKYLQISDEEDFICNSDSEEERKTKRISNFKKRLSDQEGHISKRPRIENSPNSLENQLLFENLNIASVDSKQNSNMHSEKIHSHDLGTKLNMSEFNSLTAINSTATSTSNKDKNTSVLSVKEDSQLKNQMEDIVKNHVEDNLAVSKKKAVNRQRLRTKNKKVVSDESDQESENQQAGSSKKTRSRTKQSQQKTDKRVTRLSGKRSYVKAEETINNTDESKLNEGQSPIYGIETLKAVPRFIVSSGTTGDLITDFSQSLNSSVPDAEDPVCTRSKGKLTEKEKLEEKIASGKVNDNFVRINLKKKIYVRGKKSFNFSKYKKNQWKQRKKELASGEGSLDVADYMEKKGVSTCFKCGDIGHFARNCTAMKSDGLIPLEEIDDGSCFPTLEEAEQMASQNAVIAHSGRIDRLPERASYKSQKELEVNHGEELKVNHEEELEEDDEDLLELLKDVDFSDPLEEENQKIPQGHKIPKELVAKLLPPEIGVVNPLYSPGENSSLIDTPAEVFDALRMFGHESFRPGQEKAVMRILSGQSTLVTLSTGSGKSLCYQLPAYLYSKYSHCITLVISPLVSLMDDQVTGVPSFLSAACLHTSQTQKVRDNVMQMVRQGEVNILLVSPEAVVAGEKSTGFGALLRQLPPIAFACIDEAHCISQWSHNFRPSYLMVCRVLKEKLRVKTVLGLTATATKSTAESIVKHLDIHDGMAGVISDIPVPRNLLLTVSKDERRDQALVNLLCSDRFKECDSVIVYCTRREECERIAGFLRVSLQALQGSEKTNTKVSNIAEAYHAGLSASRRKVVQKAFMSGKIRIVVATVAFGMGINKSDIRSVIHYNMPATFEGYVQEIGRAGRDGIIAHCHLFLSPTEDSDKWELRRHVHANGVDRHMIRRLLEKVFVPCSCSTIMSKNKGRRCPGHEVAIPVDETVRALDISEETISTLLCYLELHPKRFITVLSSVYVMAKVSSYNGPQALKAAAQSSPPLAMAIALDAKKGISHENSSIVEFPVVDVASAIGWDSGVVKSHLKNLEWKTVNGKFVRSAISVRYDTLGFRVKAPGDLSEAELDEALDALISRTQSQETSRLLQIETIHSALNQFSVPSVKQCLQVNEEIVHKSDELKKTIRSYFQSDTPTNDIHINPQTKVVNEGLIASDVRSLVISYRDNNFTGRAVARIFHGIQSPNYPAAVWGKCRFWRAHISVDFNAICHIATREILALR